MLTHNNIIYINITYDCQYRCVFCVANVPSRRYREFMLFSELMSIASSANKDSVYVISGGEPTLHQGLIPFIRLLSSRGAKTILQTNGYKLSDENYCLNLIKAGISEIGIPFYHFDGNCQDLFTKKKNSFDYSIRGLQNLLKIKQRLNLDIIIESKLLISKITNSNNPKIIDYIMSLPLIPDRFLLKFLVQSFETEKHKDQVELSFTEAESEVSKTVNKLISYKIPYWITGYPLCILPEKIHKLILNNKYILNSRNHTNILYNDPNISGKTEEFYDVFNLCQHSSKCVLSNLCTGPEETYIKKYGDSEINFSDSLII